MAYTRDPQTIPNASPGGSTVKEGIADQNSAAIDDLYVNLNEHASGIKTHAEIEQQLDTIGDVTGARLACEQHEAACLGYKQDCEQLAQPDNHDHDTRYYTEVEVDSALSGKSDTSHLHDTRYYTEAEVDALVGAIPQLEKGTLQDVLDRDTEKYLPGNVIAEAVGALTATGVPIEITTSQAWTANCSQAIVICVGAGGAGAQGVYFGNTAANGGAGGTTSFGALVAASGGAGGQGSRSGLNGAGGAGGGVNTQFSNPVLSIAPGESGTNGGTHGTLWGGAGGRCGYPAAGGAPGTHRYTTGYGYSASGYGHGGGAGAYYDGNPNENSGGGGGGAMQAGIVSLTKGADYTVTIGAGGTCSGTNAGGSGAPGICIIIPL